MVFIGNSTSEQMKEYIQTMEEPLIGHLFTDPTLTFHQVFQLKRGIFRSLVMPLFSGIKKYGFGGVIEAIQPHKFEAYECLAHLVKRPLVPKGRRQVSRAFLFDYFEGMKLPVMYYKRARLGVEKSHISGDSWQQGGTHQESHPADWPNMEEILPLVGIENTSVEYKKAVSDWLEVRRSNRQQKT
ncbi:hypothetical protein KUTeg_024180 [Tegillarca granosa]|uniref:Uncharacterized protein n=1 Tax=Tegillarca granosa TaxID=220873 RepID=A0ABQ9DWK6_TEGGR|nr:hypothetical protein KUTeg_024180 [Tegillarca granosa]